MKIFEHYGLQLSALSPRLVESKKFTTCDATSLAYLESLNGKVRNRILNYGAGIEIEIENCTGPFLDNWQFVEDGSLRNNGMEYKTTFGLRIHEMHKALGQLAFKFMEGRINSGKNFNKFTDRCSVHIHLDVRNFTIKQVNVLTMLYSLYEGPFFQYAGEQRRDNIFCVPLLQSVVGQTDLTFASFMGRAEKYGAFNLKALQEFGTVEFRHMEGTDDPDRIFHWLLLLASLLYYAEVTPAETVVDNIIKLKYESQYDKLTGEIFGSFGRLLRINPKELDNAVSDAKLFIPKGDN